MNESGIRSAYGADKFGFSGLKAVHWNLQTPALYEHSLQRHESQIVAGGALCAETGHHTGRSPKDKHTVVDELTEKKVWWDNNKKVSKEHFNNLLADFIAHAKGKELFAQDLYGGADKNYRIKTRVYTELAWHSLFIRTLLIRPEADELASFEPELTILDFPSFKPDPKRHGAREGSDTMVAIDFTRKIVLICGSSYAGEMKKSVFTTLNFYLPQQGVMPMHCSANVSNDGKESALFFGLSGTGKTTLSADPNRTLIGDDETGWGPEGIFNFEGGCYAKTVNLSKENEPMIWDAIRFGSVLENVVMDPESRVPDYDSSKITENTRATYPVEHIPNAVLPSMAGHPKNVVFLTADAFGVLPPISKLSREQAMYYFINGYTSKLAGTEAGVTEPVPNFSPCFGGPFLPRTPKSYADMLAKKIEKHDANVWLLNTGWSGGPYGVGQRFKLSYTRAMVTSILNGSLAKAPFETDPVFGLSIPKTVDGVPDEVLAPRGTWKDKAAYDEKAKDLAKRFRENDAKFEMPDAVRKAGPRG